MMTDHVTDNIHNSGRLKRYATWPTLTQQTVGEHCWHIYAIYTDIFGVPSSDAGFFIMHHDSGELKVGDPPFPVKANNPDLKKAYDRVEDKALQELGIVMPPLSEAIRANIKICDLLEMMIFGMHERELGNMLAVPIVVRTEVAAEELARKMLNYPDYCAVRDWVDSQWHRHYAVWNGHPTWSYMREAAWRRQPFFIVRESESAEG